MAKRKRRAREVFPEQLYVVIENKGTNDEFFSADESFEKVDNNAAVAIYTLLKVRRKRVTHELKD